MLISTIKDKNDENFFVHKGMQQRSKPTCYKRNWKRMMLLMRATI